MTLAAWNSRELAQGTFGTGVFEVVSRATAGDAVSHPDPPGLGLSFNASNLYPGASRFAWLNVSTSNETTMPGTLAVTGHDVTDLPPARVSLKAYLQYRIVRTPAATSTCDAGAFQPARTPTWLTPQGAYVEAQSPPPESASIPLSPRGADPQRLCVEVRFSPSAPRTTQGQNASIMWTFTGTSQSDAAGAGQPPPAQFASARAGALAPAPDARAARATRVDEWAL